MKTKNLRLLLILTIILLVGCNTGRDNKTIILRTTGYIETPADEAIISLRLDCINANIELAKSSLITKSNELNEKLKKYKIDKKEILTTRINLNKAYEWKNNSNVYMGYKASITTSVTIRNLQILDNLYSEFLTNTELTIGDLIYQHSKIDSLNELAYINALKNADKLSNKILSQLNVKNKEIIKISNAEISESENNFEIPIDANDESFLKAKSNLTINIGNMIAVKQIYVQYRIY